MKRRNQDIELKIMSSFVFLAKEKFQAEFNSWLRPVIRSNLKKDF